MDGHPDFGRVLEERSYFNGRITTGRQWWIQQQRVGNSLEALNAIAEMLKSLKDSTDHKLSFEVTADPETLEAGRIELKYQVKREKL
jgi:hypothetical protein